MKRKITDAVLLVLGSLLAAVSFNVFLVPNGIAPGGVSGIAVLLHYLLGLPVGVLIIGINIPLFILGMNQIGMDFLVKTALGTALLSVTVDLFDIPAVTGDLLLASVYGGILLGLGLGLVFRSGGSTGGTDIAAKVIHKHFPHLAVGMIVFAVDALTILAYGLKFGVERALYSLVTVFLSSRMIDLVLEGTNSAQAYFIISDRAETIGREICTHLERGATSISGRGVYSGKEKHLLLCLVGRYETARLKKLIRTLDPYAFIFMVDAREVMGEGFSVEKHTASERLTKKKEKEKSRPQAAR